ISKPIEKNEIFDILDKSFKVDKSSQTKHVYLENQHFDNLNKSKQLFIENIKFNCLAINKALDKKNYIEVQKICNIIRRTSGAIGFDNISMYAHNVYKSVDQDNISQVLPGVNILISAMNKLSETKHD